jgi:hypothetical protein
VVDQARVALQHKIAPWYVTIHILTFARNIHLDVIMKILIAFFDEEEMMVAGVSCARKLQRSIFPFPLLLLPLPKILRTLEVSTCTYFARPC